VEIGLFECSSEKNLRILADFLILLNFLFHWQHFDKVLIKYGRLLVGRKF